MGMEKETGDWRGKQDEEKRNRERERKRGVGKTEGGEAKRKHVRKGENGVKKGGRRTNKEGLEEKTPIA